MYNKNVRYIEEYLIDEGYPEMLISNGFVVLDLILNILNELIKKGTISYSEAREILKKSLNPTMTEKQKDAFLNKIIKRGKPDESKNQ
jgi:hypothetical protein